MFNKSDTVLLIDGDVLVYRHAVAAEHEIEWGNDIWTMHTNLSAVRAFVMDEIHEQMQLLEATKILLAFSGDQNWRKEILPTYKANRKGKRKPMGYRAMIEFLCTLFPFEIYYNLEADDVLGILATSARIEGKRIIVSVDKDLRTIPGNHFNPDHPDWGVFEIDREEADYNHLLQTLTGDQGDGYGGCPGVGPVKAEKLLNEKATWATVLAAFKKAGVAEEEALRQARVARILRSREYRIRTNEVLPWTP